MTSSPRLYVDADLGPGELVQPRPDQTDYLRRVMRMKEHRHVRLFNGRDGEWLARTGSSWSAPLCVEDCVHPMQATHGPELWFAPLRPSRTAFVVEKATELGAAALRPVRTERARPGPINAARLQRICEEASEQTQRHDVPIVHGEISLGDALALPLSIVFCDEECPSAGFSREAGRAEAILIGPEGGFAQAERAMLRARAGVSVAGLGPRVLRAETAAICALTLWHAQGNAPA